MNYNVNKVLKNIYDALAEIKYPGINQHDLANFEEIILAKDNRLSLLHWILVEFFKAAKTEEDTLTTDEGKLSYSLINYK